MPRTIEQISSAAVEKHYAVLDKLGNLGPSPADGFLRAGYSDAETKAMQHFLDCGKELGGTGRFDEVGNLTVEFPGTSGKFCETASHVDTVPFGGNFDGAAGVVAGFLAFEQILKSGIKLKHGLRLRIWRNEESSTYNSLFTGSQGAFGLLDEKFLSNRFEGQTLEAAMRSQGAKPEYIRERKRTISQAEVDSILAHVELHIEQGTVLEVGKHDIGVVSSIRGPWRVRVELSGEFDHSGATPMGIEYRKDANLALGHIIVELDKLGSFVRGEGKDLVQTIGIINSNREFNEKDSRVYQNAVPKVSGFCYFVLDVRSASQSFLKDYAEQVQELIGKTAGEFGVSAKLQVLGSTPPVESVDPKLQRELMQASIGLGLSAISMPSGAGHDAGVVAQQKRSDGTVIPVAMLFIPCRGGKSHSPEEFTSAEAIAKGASVIAETIAKLQSEDL